MNKREDKLYIAKSKITGLLISYYFICKRKMWLFSHKISFELEHQNVQIGKQLHKNRYKRQKKDITIFDTINIDFIKKGEQIVLHEIKKSKKMEKAHKYQMYFYLDFLLKHGVEAKGEINYPILNQRISLKLTDEIRLELEEIYQGIRETVSGDLPRKRKKSYCKKCAYYEFCFCDEI
ncbi:MAG: CRISPR-associated protein Cas4 [Candidatus Heimdallarchaeota archaeon]|nr:CRISPR-associated protein Cas4 [Candidatus Heimdallarchaeota archaeon]MCK4612699.1 CRISPR-associated protein Cas4 [Candidatus Heimdallarchaeota archaeon]